MPHRNDTSDRRSEPRLTTTIGWRIGVVLASGFLLEGVATLTCYTWGRENASDETLSLAASCLMAVGGALFLARIGGVGKTTWLVVGASGLFVFSKLLDVTMNVQTLNTWTWIGRDDIRTRLLENATFTVAVILLVVSFILVVLQVDRARRALAGRHAALLERTEKYMQAEGARIRLAQAIDQAAEGVAITNVDGVMQYVNPAFERLTGTPCAEALGRRIEDFVALRPGAAHWDTMNEALATRAEWRSRFALPRADGTEIDLDVAVSAVRDESGNVTNFVGIARDITTEVSLDRQLRHAQKMEALGTLAGRVAHDFNNILTLILGHCEIAGGRMPENDPVQFNIQQIAKAGNRAAKLVTQILSFSRSTEQERRPVALQKTIREALDFLRMTLPRTVELREEIDDTCPTVLADPTQVHQVIMNLATNALHAMGMKSGKLTVSLAPFRAVTTVAAVIGKVTPGRYVRLTVSDTGCGMAPGVLQRAFDPFFTTKTDGEGTGLGLSTVQGIVKSHGGGIAVETAPGQGTTIHVYFLEYGGAAGAVPDASAESPPVFRARLLLVDDDTDVLAMYASSLEQIGCTVHPCVNGMEALELLRAAPDAYDLVLMDHMMPGRTGLEVARDMLGVRSGLPIVLMTALGQGITADDATRAGLAGFVSKPVSIQWIRQALENLSRQTAIPA